MKRSQNFIKDEVFHENAPKNKQEFQIKHKRSKKMDWAIAQNKMGHSPRPKFWPWVNQINVGQLPKPKFQTLRFSSYFSFDVTALARHTLIDVLSFQHIYYKLNNKLQESPTCLTV